MSLVYLALRKSGKWTIAKKREATIPPFEALDGPYDYWVAKYRVTELNNRWGGKAKHHGKEAKTTWLT